MTHLEQPRLRILIVSGLSIVAFGCDWVNSSAAAPAAETQHHTVAAGGETSASDSEPELAKPDTDAACGAHCEVDDSVSEADRATCKLNCGSTAAATPSGAPDVADRVAACARVCDAKQMSGTDRATCRFQCASVEHPVLAACAQGCVDTMIDAWSSCQAESTDTNVSTCELTCQGRARSCVGDCGQPT